MSRGTLRLVLTLAIGFAGAYGVLSINHSPLVPGLSGDSVAYLGAAESLATEGTLDVPFAPWTSTDSTSTLDHFPPGFPVLVSLPVRFGVGAPSAALWIMAASSGLALAFAFLLVADAFTLWVGGLAAVLLFVTPAYAKLDLAIWSEPSYLAVTLGMLYLMLRKPQRVFGHGLLAACGLAIRYVGIAGTGTVAVWALLNARSRREGATRAAVGVLPSLLLLGWWSLRVGAGGGTIRRMGVYGDLGHNVRQLGAMFGEWLVPLPWGVTGLVATVVTLCTLLMGLALIVHAHRSGHWAEPVARDLARLGLIYAGLYVGVVFAARLLADPRIPFDVRLFLPITVLATMAGAASISALRASGWASRVAVALFLLGWSAGSWVEIRRGVAVVNEQGRYYTHVDWTRSPVMRWVAQGSGPYAVLYSNEPELLFYHTGRHAHRLPRQGEDLTAFRDRFENERAAIVVAYPLHIGDIPAASLQRLLGVVPEVRTPIGAVYVPPASRRGVGPDGGAPGSPVAGR